MNKSCRAGATEYPYDIIPCNVREYIEKKVDELDYSEKQQHLKRPKYFCIERLKRQCPKEEMLIKKDNGELKVFTAS